MKRQWMRPLGLAGIALLAAATVTAQHRHEPAAAPQRLGTVHFAISCSAAVRNEFDRGIALLHSFWFSAAIEGFERVLGRDPRCAMAHWGIAMSW